MQVDEALAGAAQVPSASTRGRSRRPTLMRKMQDGSLVNSTMEYQRRSAASIAKTMRSSKAYRCRVPAGPMNCIRPDLSIGSARPPCRDHTIH